MPGKEIAKKRISKRIIFPVLGVLVLAVGGIFAYFVAVQTQDNEFTFDPISIELNGADFSEAIENVDEAGPINLYPGQRIGLAPAISNTSPNSDLYSFLEMRVPYVTVDGEIVELFEYSISDSWHEVIVDGNVNGRVIDSSYTSHVYIYGGAGIQTKLIAGDVTESLLADGLTVASLNGVDPDLITKNWHLPFAAYAIQGNIETMADEQLWDTVQTDGISVVWP